VHKAGLFASAFDRTLPMSVNATTVLISGPSTKSTYLQYGRGGPMRARAGADHVGTGRAHYSCGACARGRHRLRGSSTKVPMPDHAQHHAFVAAIDLYTGEVTAERARRGRESRRRGPHAVPGPVAASVGRGQPLVVKELLQNTKGGAVLAVGTTPTGDIVVGGYVAGGAPELYFDFIKIDDAPKVDTAFAGLLQTLPPVDDAKGARQRAAAPLAVAPRPLTGSWERTRRVPRHRHRRAGLLGQHQLSVHRGTCPRGAAGQRAHAALAQERALRGRRRMGWMRTQAACISLVAICGCFIWRWVWPRLRGVSTTALGGRRAAKARGRYATLQQQYAPRTWAGSMRGTRDALTANRTLRTGGVRGAGWRRTTTSRSLPSRTSICEPI